MGTGIGSRLELLALAWGGSRIVVGVGCSWDRVGEEEIVGNFGLVGIGTLVRLGGGGAHWWHRWVSSGCTVDRNWHWRGGYGSVEVSGGGKEVGVAGWLTLEDVVVVDDGIAD